MNVQCTHLSCKPEHFPNLTELTFGTEGKQIEQQKEVIVKFLRLNPQLRNFSKRFTKFRFLKCIAKYLQSIENLRFEVEMGQSYRGKLIQIPNVPNLTVTLRNVFSDKSIEGKTKIPLLMNQLKELTMEGNFTWSDYFHVFIRNHQSIERIKFKTSNVLINSEV